MADVLKTTVRNGAEDAIRERKLFKAGGGALSGETSFYLVMGKLAPEHQARLREDAHAAEDAGQSFYVVYSYATPIAWVTGQGEVVIPDVKYSVTTSKHQAIARRALAQ